MYYIKGNTISYDSPISDSCLVPDIELLHLIMPDLVHPNCVGPLYFELPAHLKVLLCPHREPNNM